MCRSHNEGGRRCPTCSTAETRQKAADNRRKNRAAKSNLRQYFVAQGMTETAKRVRGISPSQIPSIMARLGIDTRVLKVAPPQSRKGPNSGIDLEADSFVRAAVKEARAKGKLKMATKH